MAMLMGIRLGVAGVGEGLELIPVRSNGWVFLYFQVELAFRWGSSPLHFPSTLTMGNLFSDSGSGCNGARDCNPPRTYASMSLHATDVSIYHVSPAFPTEFEQAVRDGVKHVGDFLGYTSDTEIFMWEEGGTSEAYTTIKEALCDFTNPNYR